MAPFRCTVCGNSEFDEADGRYFCSECSTQSQEFHVQEVAERDFQFRDQHTAKIRGGATRQVSGQEAKEKAFFGRPWTIYEAYQYIILAQVDALVALGVSEDLKDIVFSVWANYLRQLGVAFCRHEKLVPDIVLQTGFGRQRELNRGTFDNPKNRHDFRAKSKRRKFLPDEEERERDYINLDAPLLSMYLQGKRVKSGTRERRSQVARLSPEWMTIQKTIAFCYIGVMLTDKHILPHDIIRWIYEGKIPFLSPTHVLPQDMALSEHDVFLFNTHKKVGTFHVRHLRFEVEKMLDYLDLKKINILSPERLIPRFVDQLALPEELKSSCQKLFEKIPFHIHDSYIQADVAALAYIIVALSLALGMDGTTESQLSDCSRKLQSLIGPYPKLFIWEDWKKFMWNKFHRHFDSCVQLTQPFHKSDVQHIDSLIECFKAIGGLSKRKFMCHTHFNMEWNIWRRYSPEIRDGLVNTFQAVLDRGNTTQNTEESGTPSQISMELQQTEHFQSSTLSHLVQPEVFTQKYAEQVASGGEKANVLLEFLKTRPKTFEPVVFFEYASEDTQVPLSDMDPPSSQSEPVRWLVALCCQLTGCPEFSLTRAVSVLHEGLELKNKPMFQDDEMAVTRIGACVRGRRINCRLKANRRRNQSGNWRI